MDIVACRTVLRLVAALHARGYQRLRIAPTLSASDGTWRCAIAGARDLGASGVLLLDPECPAARFISDEGRACFGWPDAADVSPEALAERFVERYPALARVGWGADWAYAGWYIELLRLTAPDDLPVAHAGGLSTLRGSDLPLPGAGRLPCDECDPFRARDLTRAAARLEGALAAYAGYTAAARRAMLDDLGPDARALEPWESLDVLRHVLRGGWCDEVEGAWPTRLPGQVPDASA